MKKKPSKRGAARFEYFSRCGDKLRLPAIPYDEVGDTALVCFHVRETYGVTLPCREPELLARALNGKEQHGLTVSMVAEDFARHRLIFTSEIKEQYPKWVADDIFARAAKMAKLLFGFVPTFIRDALDFSELGSSGN